MTTKTTNVEHIKKKSGWYCIEETRRAVLPKDDIIIHDAFNPMCGCQPRFNGDLLVHEAMDGRKEYEQN